MALPAEMSAHIDRWIGSLPSPWWIYLRLRALGYLAPGASGEVVRRIVREAIDETARERRAQGEIHFVPAWNTLVPSRLWEEKLLSAKGEEMALWMPGGRRMR